MDYEEMITELMNDYNENMNEYEDFNPEAYEEYLDGLSKEEVTELYIEKFGPVEGDTNT